MRDDLAFAHCLVKGVDGAGLSTPFPRPRCLVQRSLSFGESGKLRSLAFLFAVEPFKSKDLVLHKMAERGHGAYIRGIWTECMKPDLYRKASVAWSYEGSQDLEQWVTLGHTALQLLYSAPFPDPVFGVPEKCPICLEPMHFPLTTECRHMFHKACLELTQSPTCPCVSRLFEPRVSNPKKWKGCAQHVLSIFLGPSSHQRWKV
ncbi:hypothetical protein TNCT_235201 [Trichonephila clavata]|uniref:RING-type domain-containing protein n=1 Tax=Trichonephila clavata TaxID=2740835 RepID=A0A8X6GT98_TRICU|nr:hypothetical protein TNCT_235201 [Trichonephila clavata]